MRTLLGLTDTPGAFGTAGQVLATNAGRTAAVWVTPAAPGIGSVTRDATLRGDGTSGSRLGIAIPLAATVVAAIEAVMGDPGDLTISYQSASNTIRFDTSALTNRIAMERTARLALEARVAVLEGA